MNIKLSMLKDWLNKSGFIKEFLNLDFLIKESVRKTQLQKVLSPSVPLQAGIISPYRVENSISENKRLYEMLIQEIDGRGFQRVGNYWDGQWPEEIRLERLNQYPTHIKERLLYRAGNKIQEDEGGQYIVVQAGERSIIIKDISFEELKHLAEDFEQESFIYKGTDGVTGMYYVTGENAGTAMVATDLNFMGEEFKEDAEGKPERQRLFTQEKRRGGVSFEYDFPWGSEPVPYDNQITKEELDDKVF